ncbi:subtilisin-like protease [Metarhizium album ARSEF 1941]|uniref:Subtilisin-like protease n=1 Tax=Metarhizium album (strain ARSEF 1941) TaxID=1081103 RepID=A0A0B2WXS2_METAS|nr:subtilisin-like protease [Metarhizium album ARSEF 1941]KHN98379.1 subtilisin-like protease [Metarhizium album ARSEF 1941]
MSNVKRLFLSALALATPSLAGEGNRTDGKYIVTLKDGLSTSSFHSHMSWIKGIHAGVTVSAGHRGIERVYDGTYGFSGYAGQFEKETLAEIKASQDAPVEQDKVWRLTWIRGDVGIEGQRHLKARQQNTTYMEQDDAPWGRAAVSHRHAGAQGYRYDAVAGEGTYAYVIDTGIRDTHSEFEGRVQKGYSAFDQDADSVGHGTHVAGIIAGKTYGVAKKASVVAVKVMDGESGMMSDILAGFDWAVKDVLTNKRADRAVINMSLGGPRSTAFNRAVDQASARGITTVVAAGNEAADAADSSPASAQGAVAVAAIDDDWRRARYSNFGPSVGIFAPGTMVLSASYQDDSSAVTISGTSMACPHIAGLAVYAMSTRGVAGGPATRHLLSTATKGKVSDSRGSPNLVGNNNVPGQ